MADVTVRDLLERYEERKEEGEHPAQAMLGACDEILEEMEADEMALEIDKEDTDA